MMFAKIIKNGLKTSDLIKKDIKKKFEYTRNKRKPHKGSRTFEKQTNLGY